MDEQVILKLVRLIYDTAKSNALIDINFINQVGEIIIASEQVEEYLKEFRIIYEKASMYVPSAKLIKVNLSEITKVSNMDSKSLKLDSFGARINFLINVVGTLLHELCHVKDYKKLEEKQDDLATRILRISWDYEPLKEYIKQNYKKEDFDLCYAFFSARLNDIYNKFWKYAPEERHAEYWEFLVSSYILKELRKIVPNIYLMHQIYFNQGLITIYNEKEIPTKFYFEQLGFPHSYKKFGELSKDLSYEERISLGLKLTKEERQELESHQEYLVRKLNI